MRRTIAAAAMLLTLTAVTGCKKHDKPTAEQASETAKAAKVVGTKASVADALSGASGLSTMARLVKSAGLEKTMNGVGNYTIFAPTDAAFERIPADQRKTLESKDSRPQLIAMLRQHVVTGFIAPADLDKGIARNGGAASMATMGGAPIRLHRVGEAVVLGPGETGPRITGTPVTSRNGVIYPIDAVIPPAAKRS